PQTCLTHPIANSTGILRRELIERGPDAPMLRSIQDGALKSIELLKESLAAVSRCAVRSDKRAIIAVMNIPDRVYITKRNPLDLPFRAHRLPGNVRRRQKSPPGIQACDLQQIISHGARQGVRRHFPVEEQLRLCALRV